MNIVKNILQKKHYVIACLILIIFLQAALVLKLYTEKDHKNYAVNLVKINTQKDSIDYLKLKSDLKLVDQTVHQLHGFLHAKNIDNTSLAFLDADSLSNSVYLAKQSNRYSQYLVDLQKKLQTIPLGLPTDGYISSNFGTRKNPIPFRNLLLASVKSSNKITENDSLSSHDSQKSPLQEEDQLQFHKGLDIAVPYGSDVRAAAAGTVLFSGQKGGYGNCVIISHGNGLATLYGHLSEILVQSNDAVKVGDVIAKSGNTGRSTGPHLHYEVHKNNTPVNPKLFMNL